jgi:hypothetical protein
MGLDIRQLFLHQSIVRKLGKSCVLSVFDFSFEIINQGGRWGNTTRALTRWQHLVASHEATDALHQAVCIVSYCPGCMAIKIVVNLPAFFVIINSVLPITKLNNIVMINLN